MRVEVTAFSLSRFLQSVNKKGQQGLADLALLHQENLMKNRRST
jgi:hypothetical protein